MVWAQGTVTNRSEKVCDQCPLGTQVTFNNMVDDIFDDDTAIWRQFEEATSMFAEASTDIHLL